MESLLKCKERLIEIYSGYDIYINSIAKFLLALVMLFGISSDTNVNGILGNPAVVLIVALICMFMPKIGIAYIVAFYTVAAVFSVSMEYAIVIAFVMLIVVLLYMQFSPEYGYMILLSAAACALNLPLFAVVLVGLLAGPAALVPTVCGVVIYYVFSVVPEFLAKVSAAELETGVEKIMYIVNNALLNKEMFLAVASAVVCILLVYVIKRTKVNHSWTWAVIVAAVINLLIMLLGGVIANASVDGLRLIIGTVISLILCAVVIFFVRNLDYKSVERVQFEDDEYYYYVKAVPKKKTKTAVKRRVVKENFDEGDA